VAANDRLQRSVRFQIARVHAQRLAFEQALMVTKAQDQIERELMNIQRQAVMSA
jgi:hypothetical protein